MKRLLIKALTTYKEKLLAEIKQYDSEKSTENLLIRTIDFIYWENTLRQYIAISQMIRKLEKQLIFVAYNANCDDDSPEFKFTERLYKNRDKLSMVESCEADGVAFMLFYQDELGKCLNMFSDNIEMYSIADNVADAKVHKCECCGVGYFGPFPYTYRNAGGCIGRTYECFVCRQYSNAGRQNIIDYRKSHSSEETLLKVMTTGFTNKK